jgi:hypothetical protein
MDLRNEFDDLITNIEGVGRWIVLRHFSSEHSDNWKPETSEAVGGPAYKYTDVLTEVYSAPLISRMVINNQGMEMVQVGSVEEEYLKFYFKYNINVKENDEIFELDYAEKARPTIVYDETQEDISAGIVMPKERYKIKKITSCRCDGGRIEYKIAYAYKSFVR